MKAIVLFVCLLLMFPLVNTAAFVVPRDSSVSAATWSNLKVREFLKLSVKDFSKLSGKKMNVKEKIAFSLMKIKMKKAMKKNPDLTVRQYAAASKHNNGWIIFAVVLGAIIIAVILVANSLKVQW